MVKCGCIAAAVLLAVPWLFAGNVVVSLDGNGNYVQIPSIVVNRFTVEARLYRTRNMSAWSSVVAKKFSNAVGTDDSLFLGAPPPPCLDAADADDDSSLTLNDPILILNTLFGLVPELPHPFHDCGLETNTPDRLSCESFPACD